MENQIFEKIPPPICSLLCKLGPPTFSALISWWSIVSKQPTHFLFLGQWLILLGSSLIFQQFVNKMTLPCQASYLFAQLSPIIFFCYRHQLLHGLEIPKVLLCAKQNLGLDLYTEVFLCYSDDDARILLKLPWNKNSFHFQCVPNSLIPTTTSRTIDNFFNFLVYQFKVIIVAVFAPAI